MSLKPETRGPDAWEAPLPAGAHILHIYADEAERHEALAAFIGNGLRKGEETYCYMAWPTEDYLDHYLERQGLSLEEARRTGLFVSGRNQDLYFAEGHFDPERIYRRLKDIYQGVQARGRPAARCLGDLPPAMEALGNGQTLLDYETRLARVLPRYPPSRVICQYDARGFAGSTILGVLRVHPLVLVDGQVYANPHFIPAQEPTGH